MKPSDLKQALKLSIKNRLPLLITGSPGIGKTDLVTQAATEEGAELEIFHTDDDAIIETIEANEYTFDEYGDTV